MDSIVEENGNSSNNLDEGHNLSTATTTIRVNSSAQPPPQQSPAATSVLTTTANVVQYHMPAHGMQVQSVIQSAANPSSVIQANAQSTLQLQKGGVVYVSKPNNTVIHATSGGGNAVQMTNFQYKVKHEPNPHHLDTNSDDSITDEDSPRRHKELSRRPSYHKIFTEISGPDLSAGPTLQIAESGGLSTIPNAVVTTTTGSLLHMPPDNQSSAFYLPNRIAYNSNNSGVAEDQTRKREIRLQKNREAARECRRKKKEYIKCLENRVAVLENQNKALIEELKSLKELYCQTKND